MRANGQAHSPTGPDRSYLRRCDQSQLPTPAPGLLKLMVSVDLGAFWSVRLSDFCATPFALPSLTDFDASSVHYHLTLIAAGPLDTTPTRFETYNISQTHSIHSRIPNHGRRGPSSMFFECSHIGSGFGTASNAREPFVAWPDYLIRCSIEMDM